MKKVALCFVLVFLAGFCFSNDTLIQKSVGGNEYIIGKAENIFIESEVLTIDLYDDYYHVSVDYVFRNDGDQAVLEVGFPEIEYAKNSDAVTPVISNLPEWQKIRNFKTSVNGLSPKVEIEDADIAIKPNSYEKIRHFYKKTVTFPAKQENNIHVEYDSDYGKDHGQYHAEYLLGSAVCWEKIENLKVIAVLNSEQIFFDTVPAISDNEPADFKIDTENNLRKIILSYTNLKLELNTKLYFIVENENKAIFGNSWDYYFDYKVYPRYMFELLTKEQLRLSRNSIYAFHGYKFKDKKLDERFSIFSFYKDNTEEFSEASFNDKERKNLELIKSVEKEKQQK